MGSPACCKQPGSSVTPSTRTSASTPSSAFDEVYALLHRLEEALVGFVATPVGAAKAAASLRLRLERQLAESIDSKRRAAEEKQGCLKKKRELELVLTTAIHINHLELLRAARENCVTMPNKLYLEAVERAANENGSFDREFQAVKQRHREVVNEEKQAAAHEVFLAAQLQVLASAVPLAQAQQGGNESVNDEQTNAELSSCIVGGVGQLCALLTDLSAQPPKRSTTAMAVLARELVLFWTLNRSVLPEAVRAAAASSFAETARALSLAVPIRQVRRCLQMSLRPLRLTHNASCWRRHCWSGSAVRWTRPKRVEQVEVASLKRFDSVECRVNPIE